jgi:hypothetical protein
MFVVLFFRAWIEMKNYRMMWKKLEWGQSHQAAGCALEAEKGPFFNGGRLRRTASAALRNL